MENSVETLQNAENLSGDSFTYTGTGRVSGRMKAKGKKGLIPILVVVGLVGGMAVFMFSMVGLYPFHLTNNLSQKILTTDATVTEKLENVFVEYLSAGTVPDSFAQDLANSGIQVGTVDEFTGDFIRTNRILGGNDNLVAVEDLTTYNGGGMVLIYNNEIIPASEVKAKLASDSYFYKDFVTALGSKSKIFYDRAGDETMTNLGINRNPYASFKRTGDTEADQASFEKMYAAMLDYDLSIDSAIKHVELEEEEVLIDGGDENNPDDYTTELVEVEKDGSATNSGSDAEKYIRDVAASTRGKDIKDATNNAAAIINAAVSSTEPYQAVRAYAGIAIAVEQTKAGNNGPIHEAANYMTTKAESSYADVLTGDTVSTDKSPAASRNLTAVTGEGDFSANAAEPYSRDRVTNTTASIISENNRANLYESANETVVSLSSLLSALKRWIGAFFGLEETAEPDADALVQASSKTVEDALYTKPSESMVGETLGERITEGAAFMNTTMAKDIGGANASDEQAIAEYNAMTEEIIARATQADRETRSPFDVTSSNTFLGSVVSSMYPIITSGSIVGNFASFLNIAGQSMASVVTGTVFADDEKNSYQTTYGNSITVESINDSRADLYGTQIDTFDPSIIDLGLSTLSSSLSDEIDENGKVKSGSGLADFAIYGTGRESTPGVLDANICEELGKTSVVSKVLSFFTGKEVSKTCDGKSESIALGKEYSNTSSNAKWDSTYKYYQAYFLETYALELTGYYEEMGTKNPTVAFKEEYYAENPKDESLVGVLSRRTGMSKEDVLIGIEALQLLAYFNNYDPTERIALFDLPEELEVRIENDEIIEEEEINLNEKRVAYNDLRNRVKIV